MESRLCENQVHFLREIGTLTELNPKRITIFAKSGRLPIIGSSRKVELSENSRANESEAAVVARGIILKFTEITPGLLRSQLADSKIPAEILG